MKHPPRVSKPRPDDEVGLFLRQFVDEINAVVDWIHEQTEALRDHEDDAQGACRP